MITVVWLALEQHLPQALTRGRGVGRMEYPVGWDCLCCMVSKLCPFIVVYYRSVSFLISVLKGNLPVVQMKQTENMEYQ